MTVRVLDTTIRDGGYEISHQFTEEDVALVVSTLDAAGVNLIEIGYGMGVGAHTFPAGTRPKERPALDDVAHMAAGKAAARRAKVGVLFGAGDIFCPVGYLDEVAAAGMDFVRLAFMPGDVTPANMRYVERARQLGLLVSINCMQTYILPPDEIARRAAMCRSAGAAWWYVVDSAGGMQPDDIRAYVSAVRAASDIEVGVHAHNNLGLAVANSLAAVDAGATLVDSTLNGLGRATGNAPTEQLVLALQARGHEPDIDVEPIARLAAMFRVLFEGKGNNPLNVVAGASMLHSRNVPAVLAQARERGLSSADFMVRVGHEARLQSCLDRFAFPPEVFERAAVQCKPAAGSEPSPALVESIARRLAGGDGARIEQVCEDLAVRAARYHVPSVLHLVPADRFPFEGALPWQSASLVGATVAWPDRLTLGEYRQPDHVVLDAQLAGAAGLPACRKRTFTCAWQDLWDDAIRAAVAAAAAAGAGSVWMPAADERARRRIAERLTAAGFEIAYARPAGERVIVVGASHELAPCVDRLRKHDVVVLIDRGRQARVLVDAVRAAGAEALTPPIGTIVAARVHELITLAAQVAPLLAAANAPAPWVDPLLAPGREQAVVNVGLSAIVEVGAQARPALVDQVAAARARTLASGTGRP